MQPTDFVDNLSKRDDIPDFASGDTLRVHVKVIEGNRQRTQVFEGNVVRRQGAGLQETYTVRKLSFGVGVERTFPVHTPIVEKIELVSRGDVRRAKLYYLRNRIGKASASYAVVPQVRSTRGTECLSSPPCATARRPTCPP